MLKPFFRPEERVMLLQNLEDWEGLAGSGTQRDEDGNHFSAKDNFIDNLTQEFFETYPERDLARQPGSPIVMSQSDRDKLHSVRFSLQFLTQNVIQYGAHLPDSIAH